MADNEKVPGRASLAALAADQYGLLTYGQLTEGGLSKSDIHYRVRSGELIPLYRGVFAMAGAPPSFEQRVLAACWTTDGVASHRCAARLFGLRGFDDDHHVDITVPARRASKLEGIVAHRSRLLETTTVRGIPVATVEQALLGLADVAPRKAEAALNSALVMRLTALPRLVQFAGRQAARGRGGIVLLRELLEEQVRAGAPTESWLEDQVVAFLRERGFPEPVRQYRVGKRRLDVVWPERMVDLEADGRLWHTSPSDRRRDAERDAAVEALGWRVERVRWLELKEEPGALAARLWRYFEAVKAAA
jgi:very-short-patch-repair endonuclease